ncbi:GMP synthetase [Cavenderia fasciculata]|uniref:GMP synthase (glutamine-hydrolyzing) n=1 Tax=Cavenderia fasciculata TaxID=261658 RepID=F4PMV8_CACFS|nr:GMP synthetase [Cavenderia fasciculata]EGG23702.1 GMP synthetase [Cavenderia fasciculata]|eukprot:XP_004361553.1 GMP synthetase [Cavenderia fasciculata]
MTSPVISTPPIATREGGISSVAVEDIATVHADEVILILDAGSQYSKVIDRRVRELNVASEIHPFNTPILPLLARGNIKAIIISGGPESVYSSKAPQYDPDLFNLANTVHKDIPILGICYGMQLMMFIFGGKVEKNDHREDGVHHVHIKQSILFKDLAESEKVLLTHGDSVTMVAPGFKEICKSDGGVIAGVEDEKRKMYGLQFHPEVDLTTNGKKILENFLFGIAGCKGSYTLEDRESIAIKEIQQTVGTGKVLVLVSGGVDSTVCAALLTKAIGAERVVALHIDNGFMRHHESKNVETALGVLGLHLIVVDASQAFFNGTTTIAGKVTDKLCITVHPEEKRKIIGDTFMRVAEDEVRKLGLDPNHVFLAQGTLRPDLIESSSKTVSGVADVIKTHHNDTELVRLLRATGRVVEPLRDLHKDEVRELGKSLGLSESLVWRQPFPGPGLAIRIICAERPFIDAKFQLTCSVLHHLIRGTGAPDVDTGDKIDQHLREMGCLERIRRSGASINPILLPVQTVGVQGDGRTYSYVAALSQSGEPDWEVLFLLAKVIPKVCHNVNRVVYIFGKHIAEPTLIEQITPTRLVPETIAQLQKADHAVNQVLLKYGLIRALSQVPVILFPISFDQDQTRSIAIRTFITNDFMTGVPAVPGTDAMPLACLQEMVKDILTNTPGISRVVYDLTSKPPGTTEWE